jgi:hypothetical protein
MYLKAMFIDQAYKLATAKSLITGEDASRLEALWDTATTALTLFGIRGLGAAGEGMAAKGAAGEYSESQINKIVADLKGDGYKNNPLRQAYEKEVADLAKLGDELLSQGMSKEEVARTLNQMRRDFGIEYKDMTPQPLRDYIYEWNKLRYDGDPLGPTADYYLKQGRSFKQIIESASKYNPDIE